MQRHCRICRRTSALLELVMHNAEQLSEDCLPLDAEPAAVCRARRILLAGAGDCWRMLAI